MSIYGVKGSKSGLCGKGLCGFINPLCLWFYIFLPSWNIRCFEDHKMFCIMFFSSKIFPELKL